MQTLVVTLVIGLAVLLVAWNAARVRSYQRDWRYDGELPGKHYPCDLRSADAEWPMRSFVGASDSALYLMADPQDQTKRLWWGKYESFRAFYKTDLRIPWSELQHRSGTMFFKEVIWFENRSRRFYVYVPKAIGEKLLIDAGLQPPFTG